MTELEKIEYAKGFIDKLANGINPIDNSIVPEDDIVNNVRLSRCFFYVSDILRRVIENGGVDTPRVTVKETRPRKAAYTLTPEQLAEFEYSDTPISATELCDRIIKIGPTSGVKKFPRKNLVKWLVSIDLLEEITVNDKITRRPTKNGQDVGIIIEERFGQYGYYNAVLYTTEAQHFVMDNIEAVLTFDSKLYKEKNNLGNQGKRWEIGDDAKLVELYKSGKTVAEIALEMQRGIKSIKYRLQTNGIYVDNV